MSYLSLYSQGLAKYLAHSNILIHFCYTELRARKLTYELVGEVFCFEENVSRGHFHVE